MQTNTNIGCVFWYYFTVTYMKQIEFSLLQNFAEETFPYFFLRLLYQSVNRCLFCFKQYYAHLQINKPAAFTVNFNGAQGKLDARVVAPSGAEDEAIIQEVDKGQRLQFLPQFMKKNYFGVLFKISTLPEKRLKIMAF